MHNLIGLMVKTRDDSAGRVNPDASVSKPVTDDDWGRLNRGAAIAKEILVKAGADRNPWSFRNRKVRIPAAPRRSARLWTQICRRAWIIYLSVIRAFCRLRPAFLRF